MMKAWQHFKTITTHKMWVMRYCFKIGLYWQGLTHDLSKYSPTEFLVGMKYYQGDRSPNNAEREDTGMSKSWMHHKGRNKHHFEYWIDYGINCDTIIKGVPMPRRYVAEMIMDRISASRECTVLKNAPSTKRPSARKCPRPLIKVLDPPALPILLSVPFPQQKYNLLQQPYKLYYKFQKGESPITWNQPPAKPNTTP